MSRSVLVSDNNPLIFDSFCSCLNSFACDLSHARTTEEALRLCEKKTFDLVFTEIELPGLSGYDLINRLKPVKNMRGTPFIATSAPADEWTLKRLRAAGFYAFFAKPLCPESIVDAVTPFLSVEPLYATATGVSR